MVSAPVLVAVASLIAYSWGTSLSDDDLRKAGNSTLFNRWRPRSHFISPHSWMNDPCGAVYDPIRDVYHLQYQFHPNHVNWGNISWGHAVSKDLFYWTDIRSWVNDSSVSLAAGEFPSGPIAQFTGTTQPVNLEGEVDGTLLTFATGIHALPTNWKIPHIPGTEVQALYTSTDGGGAWSEVGTVLAGPPDGWNVTGWRDPSFFPNPALDALLGHDPDHDPHYYMVLGSGLKGPDVPAQLPGAMRPGFLGPRMPLYSAPASDLGGEWSFLGPLWEPSPNSSLGEPDVTGSYGFNFELSGFFDLPVPDTGDDEERAWFVVMGAEGGNTTLHPREQWALWNRGDVSARSDGSVVFAPTAGGATDWGLSYAMATFVDDRAGNGGRRVMWGWANEDIEDDWFYDVAKAMGYQGAMTVPTELTVRATKGLAKSDVQDGNVWVCEDGGATWTAQTLGIAPLPDFLEKMRHGADESYVDVGMVRSSSSAAKPVMADMTDSFELKVTLKAATDGIAGINICQSPGREEYTTIFYNPANKTIGVDRTHSTLLSGFRKYTHQGYFAPYEKADGEVEDINFHLIYDRSLLEVFVNGRFALTSRIYPSRADSTGLSFFAAGASSGDDEEVTAPWDNATVYRGLANAWKERPDDSNVPLIWDTADETMDYTWWPGF